LQGYQHRFFDQKFAIVFRALIHDLEHAGVSNGQLVKEEHPLAVSDGGLSPTELHSFTLAFDLLMGDSHRNLREALYDTQEEFDRFLQLCINCVFATDVFDKVPTTLKTDGTKLLQQNLPHARFQRFSEKTDGTKLLQQNLPH
jgi:hypothetical protein